MTRNKNFTSKIIGYLDENIRKHFNIEKSSSKEIVQSNKLDIHTNKHANDFITLDSYHNTLMNIDKIISSPYYLEYDKKRNSLKYYGKVDQYVCVVVRLDKKEYFVSTFYPLSKKKIDKLKSKEDPNN